mmetsp:Transcript_53419/g.171143  ORF Transcript_53419/g.171143 Transcript_53419/m.171143 type:complete len:256 (-) Transcript_53419:19-786(-)
MRSISCRLAPAARSWRSLAACKMPAAHRSSATPPTWTWSPRVAYRCVWCPARARPQWSSSPSTSRCRPSRRRASSTSGHWASRSSSTTTAIRPCKGSLPTSPATSGAPSCCSAPCPTAASRTGAWTSSRACCSWGPALRRSPRLRRPRRRWRRRSARRRRRSSARRGSWPRRPGRRCRASRSSWLRPGQSHPCSCSAARRASTTAWATSSSSRTSPTLSAERAWRAERHWPSQSWPTLSARWPMLSARLYFKFRG